MPTETDLSDREIEILRLVATGASNKEIAQKLVISPNTVKVHLRNVFTKIGAVSRTEATLYALRTGLVMDSAIPFSPESQLQEENGALAGVPLTQPEIPQPISRWQKLNRPLVIIVLLVVAAASLLFLASSPLAQTPLATATPEIPRVAGSSRWQEDAALPEGRSGMAMAAYENALYLTGGETPQGVTKSTLRYRLADNRWENLADKPTPVTDVRAVVLGELIYVPGGKLEDGQLTDRLEVYNPRLNRWESRAALPVRISGYALAALEGDLYLFGGWDGAQVLNGVYSYDPDNDVWKQHSPLPFGRSLAAAVGLEGRIYVIGGGDGKQFFKEVQVYYPQRDRAGEQPWENRGALPEGRSGMSVTTLADTIYLAGGEGESKPEGGLPPLQYQPRNDRWVGFDRPPVATGTLLAILPLETRLHVVGGTTPGGFSAIHQSYQAIYTIVLPALQK